MADKFEEKLSICNFFSIAEFNWDINNLNILIGPSCSGKSVCMKLVFFFEKIPDLLKQFNGKPEEISEFLNEKFKEIFCVKDFDVCNFDEKTKLIYILREGKYDDFKPRQEDIFNLTAMWKNNQLDWSFNLDLKDINYDTITNRMKEKSSNGTNSFFSLHPVFIPACRSMASVKPFEEYENEEYIEKDYFLKKFLKYKKIFLDEFEKGNINIKEETKAILGKIFNFTEIEYKKENEDERLFFKHKDGIEKPLSRLASGQAENLYLLPLILDTPIYKAALTSFFVEEPCAHLFPGNQLEVIKFLVDKKLNEVIEKENPDSAFFISTHSPYIVDMINQMMKNNREGKTSNSFPEDKISIYEIKKSLENSNRFNVTETKKPKNGYFHVEAWEDVVKEIRNS